MLNLIFKLKNGFFFKYVKFVNLPRSRGKLTFIHGKITKIKFNVKKVGRYQNITICMIDL